MISEPKVTTTENIDSSKINSETDESSKVQNGYTSFAS